jgi:hypothetical protein
MTSVAASAAAVQTRNPAIADLIDTTSGNFPTRHLAQQRVSAMATNLAARRFYHPTGMLIRRFECAGHNVDKPWRRRVVSKLTIIAQRQNHLWVGS